MRFDRYKYATKEELREVDGALVSHMRFCERVARDLSNDIDGAKLSAKLAPLPNRCAKERLAYSDWVITAQQPSAIIYDKRTIVVDVGWTCPRCQRVNTPTITHGTTATCGGCHLNAEVFGNDMYVWDGDTAK